MAGDADVAVVGSGPNGLVAAVVLARAGLRVRVYEAERTAGGGARTQALTLPGYLHDVCSAVHPLGAGSPVLRRLPLAAHGLQWLQPELPLAHPLEGRSAALLSRSAEETAESLGKDAPRYRRLVGPLLGGWDDLAADALRPVTATLPQHPVRLARFGVRGVLPVAALAAGFRGVQGRALLAGLAAHAIAPLHGLATGGIATLFAVAAHEVGWPVPHGGSQAITDSLIAHLVELGGEVACGVRVEGLGRLPRARAYVLDASPWNLRRMAGDRLPAAYLRRVEACPHGPGVFKVDYALSGAVPWTDPACRRAGTVHLGGSYEEIRAALAAAVSGHVPAPPFLIVTQPSIADPSRAPEGKHTLWAYGHVPTGWDGDLTARIEDQIERFAPGFRDLVVARAPAGPAVLEARNANDVAGDITGGAFRGRRTFLRPVTRLVPYATPDPTVFLCSASTPPGPGVHGMCGYHAARVVLRRVFGLRSDL